MLELLEAIFDEVKPMLGEGKVADYIPALASVDPHQFGIAICDIEGRITSIGDADVPFSIQSISKVFNLVLAMNHYGEDMWERVGCEPSGLPFNSLVQLEYEDGIPRNPFINAGALVVSDMTQSRFASPHIGMRDFVRRLSCNDNIFANKVVADSEFEHRARNAAMAYLMKAYNNFENEVEDVLHSYFNNCALEMSCVDLARATNFLANRGYSICADEQVLSPDQNRQVNALLATSGMYDEAGSFAFKVGLPGKSGVGGGVIAVVPGRFSICVFSPALNAVGNSHLGVAALTSLSKRINWSVY
ncbi:MULTISPECIES: glutaminase B [Alteromonas]|jgi:glutaminase|uniref:Glutaminase n=1 Tax=Alteromonas stellipolaris TaxID=233316 RepID=A0AAW7Z4E8_9ALTE|nr:MULTISPECIES: glutaminase B [Alteromonas]AMJ91391.1 glutaminase A [Alteromonas sp. Mac2]ALM89804.1 Glutaminase [Alteromonas stellipolaris LMG 21856]AMJ75122.1 glutaminase A [Alteromonas stellipolaris]AMJ87528.1 glutaminase A [Alteromonas sp. Mac1]AMJ95276.1 glutaminase A [Alteromonas stellipolaris]